MRKWIVGTDWWDDCDDAVALRVVARAQKSGEIQLAGVVINACMERSVASLAAFLHSEGVRDIPIGIDRDAVDFGGRLTYQDRLAALCDDQMNDSAQDGVRLYRSLLAKCNGPVEIVEIGFLQVAAGLLQSGPDDISPLTGMELVAQKVSKFWVMAGRWDIQGGRENNFARNVRAREGAWYFCEKCPVPVTFLGWEVGNSVITGGNLPQRDILHQVLCDHGSPDGRRSWDPMLVMLALIADERKAGYRTVRGTARVDRHTGCNFFVPDDGGNHTYVVKLWEDSCYAEQINSALA